MSRENDYIHDSADLLLRVQLFVVVMELIPLLIGVYTCASVSL